MPPTRLRSWISTLDCEEVRQIEQPPWWRRAVEALFDAQSPTGNSGSVSATRNGADE